jgi:hypothetical protein
MDQPSRQFSNRAGSFGKAVVDRDGAYKAKVHNDPSMKIAC